MSLIGIRAFKQFCLSRDRQTTKYGGDSRQIKIPAGAATISRRHGLLDGGAQLHRQQHADIQNGRRDWTMELPRLTRDAHAGIIIRGYTKKLHLYPLVLQVGLREKF